MRKSGKPDLPLEVRKSGKPDLFLEVRKSGMPDLRGEGFSFSRTAPAL